MSLQDFRDQASRTYRLMNCDTEEKYGKVVVHLFARDADGSFEHFEVEGHYPSFLIKESEYNARVDNHFAVYRTESGYKDVHGNPLVRVYTYLPSQVKSMRENFSDHFEADVWFQNRYLIDKNIKTGFTVDSYTEKNGRKVVHTADVHPVDSPDIDPRTITVDIEVAADYGFPQPQKAEWPVISVVAHDSYTDDTKAWILRSPEWTEEPSNAHVFDDERFMLTNVFGWIASRQPDVLTGWYSNNFDWPYLINRAKNYSIFSYQNISPLNQMWVSRRWGDPAGKGITFFDMLDGLKKTSTHKFKDDKLNTIAEEVLGVGKVDIEDIDGAPTEPGRVYKWAWINHPETLIDYNIRDVLAVVQIDEEKSITKMFNNLRDVTGILLNDAIGNNINMIDMFILREAKKAGVSLPTSTKPDEDWYYGAYVFPPKAGLHKHVVYPDYASLYPNMMAQCNMSPETVVGTAAELALSEYSVKDCVWSYVDTREVLRVEKGTDYSGYKDGTYKAIMLRQKDGTWKTVWSDEPQYTKMYFLKPSVKQGFVANVISGLLDMKGEYKGTPLYEAVKRVVNSVYGVFGDSKSYGRGFRLFDWRIAESITLGGRKAILEGSEKFVEHSGGYIVGGDTDSVMTAITDASDGLEAIEIAEHAAEQVMEYFNEWALETYGLESHRLELEVESYSPRCFFVQDEKKEKGIGTKKRYVTEITIKDGRVLDEPQMNIKGFEAIRSDRAQITIDSQKYVFDKLMHEDDPEESVMKYINDLNDNFSDLDINDIGIPFGLSKDLDEYGEVGKRKPMPQHRGAKYMNQNVYKSDMISKKMKGKPMYIYVSEITGDLPKTYSAATPEDGEPVDAISFADSRDIPSEIIIDYRTMYEKTVVNTLEPVFNTMGWNLPR